MRSDCETKAPAVPAEKVDAYLKKLEEMKDLLGDTLTRPDTRPGAVLARINWLMVVVAGFGSAATLAGGLWFWRATRATDAALAASLSASSPDGAPLRGLGGWLIVVGFGLCAGFALAPHYSGPELGRLLLDSRLAGRRQSPGVNIIIRFTVHS